MVCLTRKSQVEEDEIPSNLHSYSYKTDFCHSFIFVKLTVQMIVFVDKFVVEFKCSTVQTIHQTKPNSSNNLFRNTTYKNINTSIPNTKYTNTAQKQITRNFAIVCELVCLHSTKTNKQTNFNKLPRVVCTKKVKVGR